MKMKIRGSLFLSALTAEFEHDSVSQGTRDIDTIT